jgi:hypothetical protein
MSITRRTLEKTQPKLFCSFKRERYHRGISKKVRAVYQISMWKSEGWNLSAVFSAEKRSLPKMKFQIETLRSNRSADFEYHLKSVTMVSRTN